MMKKKKERERSHWTHMHLCFFVVLPSFLSSFLPSFFLSSFLLLLPHSFSLSLSLFLPCFHLTAKAWRRFLLMFECTKATTSGRMGALNTAGSVVVALAWPFSDENTEIWGRAAIVVSMRSCST